MQKGLGKLLAGLEIRLFFVTWPFQLSDSASLETKEWAIAWDFGLDKASMNFFLDSFQVPGRPREYP